MAAPIKESLDQIIVSKVKQAGAATAATMSRKFLLDEGSGLTVNEGRSDNRAEKTGYDEPTRVDVLVRDLSGSLNMAKARPDWLGWTTAFFTNNHSEANAGSTGKTHTSKVDPTPATGSYQNEPAYFTLAHRRGNIADFQQHIGCAANALRLTYRQGEPLGCSIDVLGIGAGLDQVFQEVVPAAKNATSLAFAKDIHGESVDYVVVQVDLDNDGLIYEVPVEVTAVNNTTNLLTITAPGGTADTVNYLLTYRVLNTVSGYEVFDVDTGIGLATEFVVMANNVKILWAGSPGATSYTGGQTVIDEVESLEYNASWNGEVIKGWRTGASIIDYATSVQQGQLQHTIRLSRRCRDLLLNKFWKRGVNAGYIFSVYMEALGPEFEAGQAYKFNVIVPRVALLGKPYEVANGRWAEAGDLVVLKDTSGSNLPSVIFQTQNQVSGYLA